MELVSVPSYELMLAAVVFILTLAGLLGARAMLTGQSRRLAEDSHCNVLGYVAQVIGATRLPIMCGVALLAGVSQLTLTDRQSKWA